LSGCFPECLGNIGSAEAEFVQRTGSGASSIYSPSGLRGMGVPPVLLTGNHESIRPGGRDRPLLMDLLMRRPTFLPALVLRLRTLPCSNRPGGNWGAEMRRIPPLKRREKKRACMEKTRCSSRQRTGTANFMFCLLLSIFIVEEFSPRFFRHRKICL